MRWLTQRTPTIDGDRIYAITAAGALVCLQMTDGAEVWRLSRGRMYAQMLSQLELAPGGVERYEAACDPAPTGAPALAPGRYQVVGIFPVMGAELRSEPVHFVVDP